MIAAALGGMADRRSHGTANPDDDASLNLVVLFTWDGATRTRGTSYGLASAG